MNTQLIERFLKRWKKEVGAKRPVHYWYNNYTKELTIVSSECAKLIGTYGTVVEKYKNKFIEIEPEIIIKFQEVNSHYV
jgi:hypothetical protein